MRYLLALLLPPVAVLSLGKPFQAILNLVLTLCFWLPGAAHACLLVHNHFAEDRTQRIVDAVAGARGRS